MNRLNEGIRTENLSKGQTESLSMVHAKQIRKISKIFNENPCYVFMTQVPVRLFVPLVAIGTRKVSGLFTLM